MTDDKKETLATILYHLFGDYNSQVIDELTPHKISFNRPPQANSFYRSFQLTWLSDGEFQVYGIVGREKPVPLNIYSWKPIKDFLLKNEKARRQLKINSETPAQ